MTEYIIRKDDLQAVILPEKGATLTRLIKNGVDFLYTDPVNLASSDRPRCGVPFLFPIFGRLKNWEYTWKGKTYQMGIHGFAHTSAWQVAEHREDLLHLVLEANAQTLAVYPFRFRVDMTFRLEDGQLCLDLTFANTGDSFLPYNYGFHPYFLAEELSHVVVEANAAVQVDFSTGKPLPFGHGTLRVSIPEGAPETGAALAQIQSPTVIHIPEEGRKLTMEYDESFVQLVLWTQNRKQFLCVEPINGSPDGLNTGNYLTLQPGEVKHAFLRLRPECI